MSVSEFEPVRKFVRAGAGAGKTWNLTRQVIGLALDFYEKEEKWPKIVLTTFTRKATQELKERLLIYCLQEKPEAVEFVKSQTYLQITTMHGLMSLFLSRFAGSLDFPSQLKIVDQNQADFWRRQVLKEIIEERSLPEELSSFNFKRLLSYLKEYEKQYWLDGSQGIQSIEQMNLLGQQLCMSLAADLSSFQKEALADVSGEKWEPFFEVLSKTIACLKNESRWQQKSELVPGLLEELKKNKPRKSKTTPGMDEKLSKKLISLRGSISNWFSDVDHSPEFWEQRIKTLNQFQILANKFMSKLMAKKKTEGAVETNDLEFLSYHLVKKKPDLIASFQESVDAWFIDEFQDTSPLQMEILEKMIGPKSCYMVGDPQQSIYLFRGSRSEVFFNEQARKQQEGAEVEFLQKNYRSQARLLEFFNDLFPKLNSEFSKMDPALEPIEKAPAALVNILPSQEEDTELFWITERLQELLKEDVNPREIAILTRNRKQMGHLQKQLTALGFPVMSHASSHFYKRREVLDGLGLLKFLLNPWDNKNLVMLMRSPWLQMPENDVRAILANDGPAWPHFRTYCQENKSAGLELVHSFEHLESKGYAYTLRKLFLKLGLFDYSLKMDPSGRREANLWKLLNTIEKLAREPGTSLIEFVNSGSFVQGLDDIGDEGDASSALEPNKINLMTVHASKGLQFEYVFLPFLHKKPNKTTFQEFTFFEEKKMWDMRLPMSQYNEFKGSFLEALQIAQLKKREREEALRVLYVAMTRAKHQLILSWKGKPEKQSWAESLATYLPQWESDESVQVMAESPNEAVSFSLESALVNVPKTFSELDKDELQVKETDRKYSQWEDVEKAQQNRRRGVVLHKIFEALKFHSREEIYKLADKWLPEQSQLVHQAIDYVLDNDSVPLNEIIHRGHVEWGYLTRSKGQSLERRIDLWSELDETLWIVDYKTGMPQFKDKAFEQMSEYAEVLKEFLGWKGEVKLCACYPFSKQAYVKG